MFFLSWEYILVMVSLEITIRTFGERQLWSPGRLAKTLFKINLPIIEIEFCNKKLPCKSNFGSQGPICSFMSSTRCHYDIFGPYPQFLLLLRNCLMLSGHSACIEALAAPPIVEPLFVCIWSIRVRAGECVRCSLGPLEYFHIQQY